MTTHSITNKAAADLLDTVAARLRILEANRFRIIAFQNAAENADPALLEPVMAVEVISPEDYAGNIMNDLNSRRASIGGILPKNKAQMINADVPLSEMFGYATKLRNLSQGRAQFTMQFASYKKVPTEVTDKMRIGI